MAPHPPKMPLPLLFLSPMPHCPSKATKRSNAISRVVRMVAPPNHRTKTQPSKSSTDAWTMPSQVAPPRPNPTSRPVVEIYDTTLRDGSQGEGISLSVSDKLKIAEQLDNFRVHYIEGGWPGSNPKDEAFFAECTNLQYARLVAFGSTRHRRTTCETDANIQALLSANTPVVTLVGKTCAKQVSVVLNASLEENLSMISDSVRYLKAAGREVMLDAEHFFDGYEHSPSYAISCLNAAVMAGVDVLVLCDTNGGMLPWTVSEVTRIVARTFPQTRIGVHCHNDMELAVANSISAVHAGATMVQGTVNGYGERTGNANLMSIIPALQLKMSKVVVNEKLKTMTKLSRYVDDVANQPHIHSRPFVGASSFAHKGGLHVAAVMKDETTYQHIDPKLVGNQKRILVSELSGRRNIQTKLRELNIFRAEQNGKEEANNRIRIVLEQVKELENKGYSFEGAEASLELMFRRAESGYRTPFELVDFHVSSDNNKATTATVRLALIGPEGMEASCPTKICLDVGEGNGPIDAVNDALEKILLPIYAPLRSVQLMDYKVRILDNESKTKATTRVTVDFANIVTGKQWTTVYAHANIITASVYALIDGFEIALWGTMPQCIIH